MALSANTVWELRSATGSDNNGGGFVAGSGGTDYSQQDSPQLSVTDAACTGNTTVTSATGGFTAAMVGSIMRLSSGPGWYEITARTDTNTITIDRNGPNATGMTANVGGALATINKLADLLVAGNRGWLKGTTFTTTVTITFGNYGTTATDINGYTTTRGDGGQAKLTLQTNSSLTGIYMTQSFRAYNITVDCGNLTGSIGFGGAAVLTSVFNCKVLNWKSYGVSGPGHVEYCEVYDGDGTSGIVGALVDNCYVHDNIVSGAGCENCPAVTNSIIESSTGRGIAFANNAYTLVVGNTVYNNSSDGIYQSHGYVVALVVKNNLIVNNGGYGFKSNGAMPASQLYDGNAYYNNTSGARNNLDSTSGSYSLNAYTNVLDVILTADPFVNAAGGNFTLNSVAGGGASAKSRGIPGAFPSLSQVGYADFGALQSLPRSPKAASHLGI